MLKRIQALFQSPAEETEEKTFDDVKVAAAALLVCAATMDEVYGKTEQATIRQVLKTFFELSDEETEELISLAESEEQRAVGLHRWTQTLKDAYEVEERARLIEQLWEVVYADGELHDYEASLLRRVVGLIYVPDREAGLARKRVLTRLGIED
ncbi:MAG: TerB family tellurite resistance protein [Rhodobiaceae bacterium]|nr:tellurite resistance protein TerB [Rhodobiaceae bacterium]MCR9242810.1 TerB family tellurite resistance protein [Rhodobiaceae bacterium]